MKDEKEIVTHNRQPHEYADPVTCRGLETFGCLQARYPDTGTAKNEVKETGVKHNQGLDRRGVSRAAQYSFETHESSIYKAGQTLLELKVETRQPL